MRTELERRVEVTLPELGANLLEAVVVAWEKHPGDWIDRDEPICIVSADGTRPPIHRGGHARRAYYVAMNSLRKPGRRVEFG